MRRALDLVTPALIDAAERRMLPDALVRLGIQRVVARRLETPEARDPDLRSERHRAFVAELRRSPIAVETAAANAQHYELPAEFFDLHLGAAKKYSCALYRTGRESLDEAERAMLELTAARADLVDGQRVLDLGCGWGSLSLWLAERHPRSTIVGFSNSARQRAYVLARARERGLSNLSVVTGDLVHTEAPPGEGAQPFDRIVSVEMFEHMRNYQALLARLRRWLRPEGKLFVHVFAHKLLAYPYEDAGADDWMSRHFFTGGLMPSAALLLEFQDDLRVEEHHWLSGRHYERTANHWLANLDAARAPALELLRRTYGADAERWLARWRIFYMAVAELFGFRGGDEWGVSHVRFAAR
jgi:cyclopropane-fatty-acyl-phospholipid synthase